MEKVQELKKKSLDELKNKLTEINNITTEIRNTLK